MITTNYEKNGLIPNTMELKPTPEIPETESGNIDYERLSRILGLEDIKVITPNATNLLNGIPFSSVKEVSFPAETDASLSKLTFETGLDKTTAYKYGVSLASDLKSRVHRSIQRMLNVKGSIGVNLHCALLPGGNLESQEVVPCMKPDHMPGLSTNMLVHLIRATEPSLRDNNAHFYIAGASAFRDSVNAYEGVCNEVIFHAAVRRNQFGELSSIAKGEHGNKSLAVQPKTEIEMPNAILVQAAVYVDNSNSTDMDSGPYFLKLNGDITPQRIIELINQEGFQGTPMGFQMFMRGENQARAVHSAPQRDYDTIQEAVGELFSNVNWTGHAVASGIRFETPYSRGGHFHMVSPDGKNAGHWIKTKGEALLVVHPLPKQVTALYDPTLELIGS